MRDLQDLFRALERSAFRRRFQLGLAERKYLRQKGLTTILEHARDFIAKRLAPAHPAKDGKQTPWRGHPVFIAQHATATCCRGCLEKWHAIERGQPLSAVQQAHIVSVLERWLLTQTDAVD
ncbi:MAG: DUF4186 domain-containing protein [Burkholderiales bacterium]